METQTKPLVIERTFNAPVHKVWEAITDNDKLKQWYFDIAAFKPEVGFTFEFYGSKDGKKFLHLCRVTEVIPNQKLSYTWKYDGYPGESLLTFELFAEGDKTRLVLTHSGLNSFPVTDTNDFAVENFTIGWTQLIGTNLKTFVEKTE